MENLGLIIIPWFDCSDSLLILVYQTRIYISRDNILWACTNIYMNGKSLITDSRITLTIRESKLASRKFYHRFPCELWFKYCACCCCGHIIMQCRKIKKLQFLLRCLITNVFHHLAFSRLLVATSVSTAIENLPIQVLLVATWRLNTTQRSHHLISAKSA